MTDVLLNSSIHLHLAAEDAYDALSRRVRPHRREAGEVTSQMILVAVFAALAIAVGAIVWTKTTDKAEDIDTDTPYTNTGGGGDSGDNG